MMEKKGTYSVIMSFLVSNFSALETNLELDRLKTHIPVTVQKI